jgi:hypothetical protein
MTPLKARVRNGRLQLDEPTTLPEGSEVELVPVDSWDQLEPDDRQALHDALTRSATQAKRGQTVDSGEALKRLKARG